MHGLWRALGPLLGSLSFFICKPRQPEITDLMKRVPEDLRLTIAANLRYCRERRFPGKGGSRQCAEALGVTQQQWSPWELGKRMPNENRLVEIAQFFGTTVEWLRQRHNFHNDDDAGRRLDVHVGKEDVGAFFSQLERILSHPDRGDVVISITMKPGGRKNRRKHDAV